MTKEIKINPELTKLLSATTVKINALVQQRTAALNALVLQEGFTGDYEVSNDMTIITLKEEEKGEKDVKNRT